MNINCPHCQAVLTVHPSQAGLVADCPKCTGKFHVPVPMAKPATSGNRFQSAIDDSIRQASETSSKKATAGILAIVLGGLGIHKFYLGLNNPGLIMLAISLSGIVFTPCLLFPVFGPMIMSIIGLIEGVIYLTKSDEGFYTDYIVDKKEWF